MEMVIPNWALGLLAVIGLAVFAGWGLLAFNVIGSAPEPENRPAPTGLIEQNEQKRQEALRRVADRQRLQRQREASARISRGF
jgi:hypothetical protein